MSALAMTRVLGIDLGQARIGLALSDELQMLAHPLETIPGSRPELAAKRVAELVKEKNVSCVVIGLPRHLNGSVGASGAEALAFVERLRPLVTCEVRTWDERLSTVAANRALRDAGKKTRETRRYIDQVAAQMILQGYLDCLQLRAEIAP